MEAGLEKQGVLVLSLKEAAAAAVVVGGEARSCSQTLKRARHSLWSRGCAGGHCTLCNMGSRRSGSTI